MRAFLSDCLAMAGLLIIFACAYAGAIEAGLVR